MRTESGDSEGEQELWKPTGDHPWEKNDMGNAKGGMVQAVLDSGWALG